MRKVVYLLPLFLLCSFLASAQTKEIKGKITDSASAPVEGATITTKGSKAVSDKNGNFSIKVPASQAKVNLEISFTGFETQKLSTDGKEQINVVLKAKAEELVGVVVNAGYFVQKPKNKTITAVTIGEKDLKDNTFNNLSEAIVGKMAGVTATTTDGSPDAEVNITSRPGSLTQNNKPLTVVDGIIVEDGLNSVSPNDVEAITFLKDASATSVYGARGANGVFVITTKSGKPGKMSVSYNGYYGVRQVNGHLDVLDPYDYVLYQWERNYIAGGSLTSFRYGTYFDTLSVYKNIPAVDWQDEVFGRDATSQSHNLSISGGTKATQYNLSLTSNKDEGVLIGTQISRKIATFKFDHRVNEKLKVGFKSSYNYQEITGPKIAEGDESQSTNKLKHAVRYQPFLLPGQEVDRLDPDITDASSALINPIVANTSEYRKIYKTYGNVSGYITYKFTKYLSFKSTAGLDTRQQQENNFYGPQSTKALSDVQYIAANATPIARINSSSRRSLTNSNVFTFTTSDSKKAFALNNTFDALIGEETYDLLTKSDVVYKGQFPTYYSAEQAFSQMTSGKDYINGGNEVSNSLNEQQRLLSFFGRLAYDYKNKYYVTVSYRADGSSIFQPGKKQWGYFPSASLAWRVLKEKFGEKINAKYLSELKFRLSYGESGNNNVDPYYYLNLYNFTSGYNSNQLIPGRYVSGFWIPDHIPNENLVWETTASLNAGVDLGFFKDRLSLSVDVYKNVVKDLLTEQPIPLNAGYGATDGVQLQNIGQTSIKGIEIQLAGLVMKKKNFTWNVNFNIAFSKRKLDKFNSGAANYRDYASGWAGTAGYNDFRVQEGQEIGLIYGFITDGFYKASDFNFTGNTYNANDLKTGVALNKVVSPLPGTIKFKDISGPAGKPDGIVDDFDKTILGNTTPKYTGGFTNQFTYKGFDMSIFVNWVVGNKVLNANKLDYASGQSKNANLLSDMSGRWRIIDDAGNDVRQSAPADYDALNANATIWQPNTLANFPTHSWAVEDGSFLRFNNFTLGYSLPASIIKKIRLVRLRVYGTATNFGIITNYTGYDPEVSTRNKTFLTPGVDYSGYPKSRTFVFGVNVTL